MITIGKITEQAKRLIKGGNPSAGSNVWSEEIREYIGQCVNKMLKSEVFTTVLQTGETIPSGCMLATYNGIPVEQYKKTSRAKLPAMPVSLPRNMGLFYVGDDSDDACEYIPLQPGQRRIVSTQSLLNELLGITYEPEEGHVVFSKDLSDKTVCIKLVVMDASKYGDYDILPLAPDMEKDVIDMVVARFTNQPSPDKIEDSGSEPTKQRGR